MTRSSFGRIAVVAYLVLGVCILWALTKGTGIL